MSKTVDDLERNVEKSRDRLDRTLGSLQSRFNMSDLTKDLASLRRSGLTVSEGAERLITNIKAHPVPAILICAGIGSLVNDIVNRATERRRLALLPDPHLRGLDADLPENSPDRLHERLDDALKESFPGSDPISVRITK